MPCGKPRLVIAKLGSSVIIENLNEVDVPSGAEVVLRCHAPRQTAAKLQKRLEAARVHLPEEAIGPYLRFKYTAKLRRLVGDANNLLENNKCPYCSGVIEKFLYRRERRSGVLAEGTAPAHGKATGAAKVWHYDINSWAAVFNVSPRTFSKWINDPDDPLDPADPKQLAEWIKRRCS